MAFTIEWEVVKVLELTPATSVGVDEKDPLIFRVEILKRLGKDEYYARLYTREACSVPAGFALDKRTLEDMDIDETVYAAFEEMDKVWILDRFIDHTVPRSTPPVLGTSAQEAIDKVLAILNRQVFGKQS